MILSQKILLNLAYISIDDYIQEIFHYPSKKNPLIFFRLFVQSRDMAIRIIID